MAVDGLRKGRQYTSKTKLGILWSSIWDEYESCAQNGIAITITKAKSHSKAEHKVPVEMKQGNDVADHHAGLGVRECPQGEANRIRNLDSKVWWFQERMVQALMLLPKRGRHPHERQHLNEAAEIKIPHNRQRQAGARLMKHEVNRRGPMIECKRCGQFWESTATNLLIAQGMCPGPRIYMGNHNMKDHGLFQANEAQSGGASTNCIKPTRRHGIGVYYTARIVAISRLKGIP